MALVPLVIQVVQSLPCCLALDEEAFIVEESSPSLAIQGRQSVGCMRSTMWCVAVWPGDYVDTARALQLDGACQSVMQS